MNMHLLHIPRRYLLLAGVALLLGLLVLGTDMFLNRPWDKDRIKQWEGGDGISLMLLHVNCVSGDYNHGYFYPFKGYGVRRYMELTTHKHHTEILINGRAISFDCRTN